MKHEHTILLITIIAVILCIISGYLVITEKYNPHFE